MKRMVVGMRGVVMGLGMLACVSGAGQTQSPLRGTGIQQNQQKHDEFPMADTTEKQVKQRNDERQKRLISDTDKLLALATSLHDDVAKTNKDVMSLDVIKRADEIEKLAHNVKERMKG